MQQHELAPPRGSKRPRKRVGRGNASGQGTYAGRGLKGQQSRSGYSRRPGFEGGQTSLIRRLPTRRGFRNPFRVSYTPVNIAQLAKFEAGSDVTPESLQAAGVVRSLSKPIKILADGDLAAALTVRTHRVSSAARAKIEAAGGTVEELTPRPEPKTEKRKKRAAKKAKAASPAGKQAADEEPTPTDEPSASADEAGASAAEDAS